MREEHPIDERFKALYDAEAAPPGAVRDALARQLGWDAGTAAGSTWRSWSVLLVGAVLAVSSASQLFLPHTGNEQRTKTYLTERNVSPISEISSSSSRLQEVSEAPIPEDSSGKQYTVASVESSRTDPRTTPEAFEPRAAAQGLISNSKTLSERGQEPDDVRETNAKRNSSSAAETSVTVQSSGGPSTMWGGTREQRPSTSEVDGARHLRSTPADLEDQRLPDEDAVALSLLYTVLPAPTTGTPVLARRPAPYVLANGQWWLGLYAGMGQSTGTWRGQHAEPLNTAERWRGSTQWGAQLGRSWRSGWSISAGAGLELIRSTFTHEEVSEALFTEVDTTWTATVYNNTEDLVYTWNIDTLMTTRPTEVRRTDARNRYGAIQIPLTVAWHGDLRRFRYGLLGGLVAYVPTQREGNTLVNEVNDAGLRIIDLTDRRVDDRFRPRMSTQIGVSLGYALTEHLALYAEPVFYAPLRAFTSPDAPLMKGYSFQIRLQHEFGRSPR